MPFELPPLPEPYIQTTLRDLKHTKFPLYEEKQIRDYAEQAISAAIERLCSAIKEADDTASGGDYMLTSDDCISVIRGTWRFEP